MMSREKLMQARINGFIPTETFTLLTHKLIISDNQNSCRPVTFEIINNEGKSIDKWNLLERDVEDIIGQLLEITSRNCNTMEKFK